MKSKETLRKTVLSKRRFMDADDTADRSRAIIERLKAMDEIRDAESMCVYFAKVGEVDTQGLIDWALGEGKDVFSPVTHGHGVMEWTRVREGYTLKSGALGIPVLEELEIDSPPGDALVIVPCVGFADNGHRIGHGAGYYDRFLAEHAGLKIGIAFEAQRVPNFEVETHDVPMNAFVTEAALYRIGKVG